MQELNPLDQYKVEAICLVEYLETAFLLEFIECEHVTVRKVDHVNVVANT